MGLLNHSLVHPREVFADAITDRAASIICVHNHPSGTLDPSSQDIAITRHSLDAGTLVGIRLLDHLIVTDSGWLSMKETGAYLTRCLVLPAAGPARALLHRLPP